MPADVFQHMIFTKKHEQGTLQINKALKYRKQMGNSSDVRAGRYDLVGLKMMSLTPRLVCLCCPIEMTMASATSSAVLKAAEQLILAP